MLPKKNRLKNKKEFQDAYLQGKFFSSGPITVKIAKSDQGASRFGFVVGKNYSKKAVDRNNAKRILRAAAAPVINNLIPGFDLIIGIRKPLPGQKLSMKSLSESLRIILEKNNLLK